MKKYLFFAASALVMLASCSQSDDLSAPVVADNTDGNTPVEFGTYVGRNTTSRAAAAEGAIEATKSADYKTATYVMAEKGGFGVFAYYTEGNTYGQRQHSVYTAENGTLDAIAPNFMYNQKVEKDAETGDGSEGSKYDVSTWKYSPIKYWPNEIAEGNVDGATNNAQGSQAYGNVSFFAYAPYTDGTSLASDGITGISSVSTVGDPTITYTIPSDINEGGNFVDLLWGTYNATDNNVLGSGNVGVQGDGNANNDKDASRTYKQSILDEYTTNADLTKQKTQGKIGFAFKHALASIGGSNGTATYGILAQLDIDSDEGAITGGEREKFQVTDPNDAWRTIVTIKSITITNDLNGSEAGLGTDAVELPTSGTLNLATGQWTAGATNTELTQKIGTKTATTTDTHAELNPKLAEYYADEANSNAEKTWISQYATVTDYFKTPLTAVNTGNHPGVTETAQNVYKSTSQSPFILIPGVTPKFKITVEYVVRTYDANLASTKPYSEVSQKISKTIEFSKAVELNKHYNILMHLGLTGIKFTATVSDWTDVDPGTGVGQESSTDVHLPINVKD